MVRVGKIKHINIYSDSNGNFIVHNTRKEFSVGHSHLKSYNTAKYVAYLVAHSKIPKKHHLSDYLYQSVIRVSSNKNYITKMKIMWEEEKRKRKG